MNHKTKTPTVFLGLSGGVDSSVAALLLKNQGYRVVGVYMKNWSKNLPGMECPWAADLADAKRIAVQLDIDFRIFDFETEYKSKVVDYMLSEFKAGRTPNPDIICNQEIKFKLFYQVAIEQGADFIATGHYAGVSDGQLKMATDSNKDQTYFLYRISQKALEYTIFPLSQLTKPEVKQIAIKNQLATANKPESMGVCFVGEVGIKDFLSQYLPSRPGPILDSATGQVLGTHDGVHFYTIGQRHGLNLGGGLPYYIVGKDLKKHILYVSRNLNHQALWTKILNLDEVFLRPKPALDYSSPQSILVRLRHRAPLIPAVFYNNQLQFKNPVKTPASGQSAVFYRDQACLGGGIISS